MVAAQAPLAAAMVIVTVPKLALVPASFVVRAVMSTVMVPLVVTSMSAIWQGLVMQYCDGYVIFDGSAEVTDNE